MRVLAAAFEDPGAANSTLRELRRRYRLQPGDAGIAPLGSVGAGEARTLLAGRFYDDAVPEVKSLVAQHGGRVVSDVDEQWTRSPVAHGSLDPDLGGSGRPAQPH